MISILWNKNNIQATGKDIQKEDDVRLSHKLSLAAAMDVALREREKGKKRQMH